MRIISVGYEGRSVEDLMQDLRGQGVRVLVDVRLNAISRRPGFSKSALRQHLAESGIEYRHLRALGNPKENRPAFAEPDPEPGRALYRKVLHTPEAMIALEVLAGLAGETTVAVLCFENDEQACHRHVILDELRARSVPIAS